MSILLQNGISPKMTSGYTVPPTNYFPREFSRIFANFREYSRMKKKKKKKKKNIFFWFI